MALIDELRRGQNAPVHMIDQISRSLPEMTWLTSVKQEGYDVTIEGRCTIADGAVRFRRQPRSDALLQAPGRDRRERGRQRAEGRPELIEFTIKGTFQMAGIEPAAGAEPAGAGEGRDNVG